MGWFCYETAHRLQQTTYQLLYGHLSPHRLPSRRAQRQRRQRTWCRQGNAWHPLVRALFPECGIVRVARKLTPHKKVLRTACPQCGRLVSGLLLLAEAWTCKFCGPVGWRRTRDRLTWASARLAYAHRMRLNGWMLGEAKTNLEKVLWPIVQRKTMPVGPVLLGLTLVRVVSDHRPYALPQWRAAFRLPTRVYSGRPSWVQTVWGPWMVAALVESGLHPTAYRARWLAGRWDMD